MDFREYMHAWLASRRVNHDQWTDVRMDNNAVDVSVRERGCHVTGEQFEERVLVQMENCSLETFGSGSNGQSRIKKCLAEN